MKTALLSPSSPNIATAAAIATLAAALCLASCTKLRSPEELLRKPDPWNDPKIVARAEELFQRNCAICHGDAGRGDGRYFASDLEPAPADLTGKGVEEVRELEGLQKWIREGSDGFGRSKLCPPWGYTLTDEEVAILARFVISLRDDEPPPTTADQQS